MPDETEDSTPEIEIEFHTSAEYLAGAFNAVSAMNETDPMTAEGEKLKRRIIRKSIKIIDKIIDEYYQELFDPARDTDDE